jgi:peptidoglycan/LPS O-acetylase OafA/YrhL
MSSAAPRLPFLDALRGYAILAVMAVHVEQVAPVSSWIGKTYAQHGRYGVQLFFVVSAVSIAMAWHARADGYGRFLTRRCFRLLPALSLAVLGYAALDGHFASWWQTAMTLTFVNGLHPFAVNGAVPGSWTLSAEMMFYLSVPVLAASIRSLRSAAIWLLSAQILVMAAAPAVVAFWNAVNPTGIGEANGAYFGMSPVAQAKWFILGWTIYLLLQRPRLSPRASQALFGLALGALMIAPFLRSWTLHELAFTFGIPAAVYAMACGAASVLDNAIMRWLGTVSYSMYLWHFVVWTAGGWLGRPSFLPLYVATVVITTLCASLTYALIERPGIRLGAALLRGRFARPSPQLDANAARAANR